MKTQRFLVAILFFLGIPILYSGFSNGIASQEEPSYTLSDSIQADTVDVNQIIEYAKQFIGIRYRYGSNTPARGFDCSGFTQYVYKKFNYSLPRSAAGQGEIGTLIEVKDYQPGDLVFFTGSRNVKGKVGHVGMIVKVYGENDFDFIHSYSPKRKGIIIQHISVRKKGYLFVKRVIQ